MDYHFKARSWWFGTIYYLSIVLIGGVTFFIGLPSEIIIISLHLTCTPLIFIPLVLQSEFVIRNRKIIFIEKSTHYDLYGNREKDQKSIFISIDEIRSVEKINPWWSRAYLRIWINDYKIDSQIIAVDDVDKFINVLKSVRSDIQIKS